MRHDTRMNGDNHWPLRILVCRDQPAQLPFLQSSADVGPARRQECVPRYLSEGRESRATAAHPVSALTWPSQKSTCLKRNKDVVTVVRYFPALQRHVEDVDPDAVCA